MTVTRLPALWVDDFRTSAGIGIYLVNAYPEDGAQNVGVSQHVVFDLISTHTSGVDLAHTTIEVGGSLAMLNGVWQAGFAASTASAIAPHDYRVTVVHDANWTSEQSVAVHVTSRTIDAAYSVDSQYTFTAEDITAPRLLSARAVYADSVRLTFDEAMLAIAASAANDALNPGNYSIAFVPETDREAGVSASVESVSRVSDTEVDLATSRPLSFGRTYRVACGDIADDSVNRNVLESDARTAEFVAWTPPAWPGTRRFSIWDDLLAEKDRTEDEHGDLERLCSAWQDSLDVKLWELDAFPDLWDIDRMPGTFCDALLADLGNPFDIPMTTAEKRKLIDLLVPSYGQRGTDAAVVNLARFFMGIEVTVTPYNGNDQVWTLEHDAVLDVHGANTGLGVDSVIGPSAATPELYTFEVYSAVVLTETQRQTLRTIIENVKVAHEHYVIRDPSDIAAYDPWELGISHLGVDTYLH